MIGLYNKNDKKAGDVAEIISIYNDICSVESAKNEIKKYTEKANAGIALIEPAERRMKMKHFSDMLLNRHY